MEESEMNMEKIALKNDIYLYYWIYYMKPIFSRNDIYSAFLEANTWVSLGNKEKAFNQIWSIDENKQKITRVENTLYRILNWII